MPKNEIDLDAIAEKVVQTWYPTTWNGLTEEQRRPSLAVAAENVAIIAPLVEAAVSEKIAAQIERVAAAARAEADETAMARGGTRDAFIDGRRLGIQSAANIARYGATS